MSRDDVDGASDSWLPILRVSEIAWLGLKGAVLFIGDFDHPKRELDLVRPVGLLPLLERPYERVVEEVADREAELACPPGSLKANIPFAALASVAVDSGSDYWAGLALDWLAVIPASVAALAALEHLSCAEWASQDVRHRARGRMRELPADRRPGP